MDYFEKPWECCSVRFLLSSLVHLNSLSQWYRDLSLMKFLLPIKKRINDCIPVPTSSAKAHNLYITHQVSGSIPTELRRYCELWKKTSLYHFFNTESNTDTIFLDKRNIHSWIGELKIKTNGLKHENNKYQCSFYKTRVFIGI